jgi:hypothetical protein
MTAGAVENKDAVRVDPRFDLRARLPLMHSGREADPNTDSDVDVNETFRAAKLGHFHFAGKVEALGLSVADGHRVSAKAKPVNAIRQSRQSADEGEIATAFQRDERAALLDHELIQWGIGKDSRGFDVLGSSIDAGGRSDLGDSALVQSNGRAAEQEGFRRLRRRVDEDSAGLCKYARQFLAQFLAQLIVEIG